MKNVQDTDRPVKAAAITDSTNIGEAVPNPYNPAALRLAQTYADTVGVKKLVTTVPVRKPNRQEFVRVHPDPAYRLTPAAIIEIKEDREVYLVLPGMAEQLPGEFSVATLFTAINRQGVGSAGTANAADSGTRSQRGAP